MDFVGVMFLLFTLAAVAALVVAADAALAARVEQKNEHDPDWLDSPEFTEIDTFPGGFRVAFRHWRAKRKNKQ